MNRAPARDEADRLRDRLERVVAGLADDDVVGVGLGHDEAGLVQSGREARLADHERGRAGHLAVQEVGGRQRGRPDRFLGHDQPGCAQPRAQVARREDRVVRQHEERRALVAPLLQQLGCAGDRGVLMDEHAVHVGQPAFDVGSGPHAPSLSGATTRTDGGSVRLMRLPGVGAPSGNGRRVEVVAREQAWDPRDLPDLTGRSYLVTGANAASATSPPSSWCARAPACS